MSASSFMVLTVAVHYQISGSIMAGKLQTNFLFLLDEFLIIKYCMSNLDLLCLYLILTLLL